MQGLTVIIAASIWAIVCALMAKGSKKIGMGGAICLGLFLRVIGVVIIAFIIKKDNINIVITLGSNKAQVNGMDYYLDSVAFAENNRTYLPVRFISENLGAEVIWDAGNPNEVIINAK